jgi:hypothetical protein
MTGHRYLRLVSRNYKFHDQADLHYLMKRSSILGLCAAVGIAVFFVWADGTRSKATKASETDILQAAYSGRVVAKRIATEIHNIRLAHVQPFIETEAIDQIILPFDTSIAYARLQVGDTIFKVSGDSSLFILKGDQSFKVNLLSTVKENLSEALRREVHTQLSR